MILGNDEGQILLLTAVIDGYDDRFVVRKVRVGRRRAYQKVNLGRNLVIGADLALDFSGKIGRSRLGYAAQANGKQEQERTSN
jgi:hypothetical protein